MIETSEELDAGARSQDNEEHRNRKSQNLCRSLEDEWYKVVIEMLSNEIFSWLGGFTIFETAKYIVSVVLYPSMIQS